MADPLQNFVDGKAPLIGATWLNKIDAFVNTLFQSATTVTQALTALGFTAFGATWIGLANVAAALAALGGTTVGVAVFTAASAATARTALVAAGSGAVTASGLTEISGTLLGRTTAGIGAIEYITTGPGLSLSADVLDTAASISFSVTSSVAASIASATDVIVPFDTAEFNVGTYFNLTTHSFLPLVAGKYQFNFGAIYSALAGTNISSFLKIFKNGVEYKSTEFYQNTTGGKGGVVSCLLAMNGTTDHVEFYVNTNGTGTSTLSNSTILTWANGARVGA